MKPFEELDVGDSVENRQALANEVVQRWKYGRQCAPLGGGLPPSTILTITEISTSPGSQWVRLALPWGNPAATLKVSETELERGFVFTRKSRPPNNFHCFEGVGLQYWRDLAEGMSPAPGLLMGRDGAWWNYKKDVDGYALQNGGMYSPQIIKLNPDYYFRFYGTTSHNVYGANGGMSGGWWIDYDNLKKVVNFADAHDYPLARAASLLLVIPREWQDCGYLGCGLLRKPMKAFVGKGKPATGRISPGVANRDPRADPAMMSPAYLEVKQYLVPGSREEIAAAFERQSVKQVIRPGVQVL